jgi:hypothetical protein
MMEAPRNEALMLQQLYQSGLIAPLIPSRDALTLARHKKIAESQGNQQMKERRRNEADRSNHKMQMDELKENLRTGRMPNIRVANAELANLQRMIDQLDSIE